MSYREYPPAGPLLIGYDPECVLEKNHLARFVERIVEESLDVTPRRSQVGNSPFNPKLLVKVLLYGYSTGLRSSRQLEKQCDENLAYRYLTRGETPSYRTLCSARVSLRTEIELCWQGMFVVADELGIKRLGRLDLDSTKIKADVSKDSVVNRSDFEPSLRKLKEILAEAQSQDDQEASEGYAGQTVLSKSVGDDHMREVLRRVRKIVHAEKEGTEPKPAKALVLGPKTLPRVEAAVDVLTEALSGERKHVSLTDPDAPMMGEGRHKKIMECHAFEVSVDNGLLVCAQTSQSAADNGRLLGLVEGAKGNEPDGITHVTADSGYFGSDNIVKLDNAGIDTCILDATTASELHKGVPVGSSRPETSSEIALAYDAGRNCYVCGQGNVLEYKRTEKPKGQTVAVYRAKSDCTDCPLKDRCMTHQVAKRRVLKVGVNHEQVKSLMARFRLPEHLKRYNDRNKNVETIFAFCRTILNFRHWMLRGKEKIAAEAALLASAYQLRKLHAAVRTQSNAQAA